ncbi:hypothetical protein [Azotobacter salinestris]|uniref:hypothetical protein n=1 Tax=Azotobacter salinestris TaxID=69964 RepID=UPI0032DE87C2
MSVRQVLHFPGTKSIPGYPTLDVSEAEIEVANIPSLAYWPGLFDWDINGDDSGFLDRVTDAPCPVTGAVSISSGFSESVNGEQMYYINVSDNALRIPLDTSGSFTVGMVVGMDAVSANAGYTFGSYSPTPSNADVPAPWWISSGTGELLGKASGSFGGVGLPAGNHVGQIPDSSALAALVFVFDRQAGSAYIRINGVEVSRVTNDALKTVQLFNELSVGAIMVAGGASLSIRKGHLGAVAAFTDKLSGAELASLEAMLAEVAA